MPGALPNDWLRWLERGMPKKKPSKATLRAAVPAPAARVRVTVATDPAAYAGIRGQIPGPAVSMFIYAGPAVPVGTKIAAIAGAVPAPTAQARADAAIPPVGSIIFKQGVAQRISVAGYVAAGDRYNGGFFDTTPGYKANFNGTQIGGITFDPITRELVYDGGDINRTGPAQTPNTQYWIGVENPPYNAHWQYPPTALPMPQPVAGISKSFAPYGSKHTRARYCSATGLIHIFGGDSSTFGIVGGGSNGRLIVWVVNPTTNVWTLGYDVRLGLAGEPVPLSPDLMGWCWMPDSNKFFVSWGVARPGYANQAQFAADGYLETVYPADEQMVLGSQLPCFTFDPTLARPRFALAGVNMPWDGQYQAFNEYDPTSRRVYQLSGYGAPLQVAYLQQPLPGAWVVQTIDMSISSPQNLTGSNDWATDYWAGWPVHVDDTGRWLYFMAVATPALLALSLPGNPVGEGKVKLVCRLPCIDLAIASMALASGISGAWIPEHRSVVIFWEPLWHEVGPQTSSLTVNVDTGVITEGPRFPNYDGGRNRPWFPNELCWYPPTQELFAYGFMWGGDPTNETLPINCHRYAWVP